jgi:hypothetical protein
LTPIDASSNGAMPRADVAHLMLRVLEQAETIKQVIGIAN